MIDRSKVKKMWVWNTEYDKVKRYVIDVFPNGRLLFIWRRRMNIDKIYKPLEAYNDGEGLYYDIEDVQELEEKYKRLLTRYIMDTKWELFYPYPDAIITSRIRSKIDLIEKLTGIKWEDIVNIYESEQS